MRTSRIVQISIYFGAIGLTVSPLFAMPVHNKTAKSYTAGHAQLSGGNGEFGVVYSLQTRWNEEIISARYTVDPFLRYEGCTYAKTGHKLLMLDIAVKNPRPVPQTYNTDADSIIAFDQHGNQYPLNDYSQASEGEKGFSPTLNPGQGAGQPGLHDPLRVVGQVDGNAHIEKIVINAGRLDHTGEKVLRFYMSTATAAEDGAQGDPRNAIAPLPADVRDPSDPTGATTRDPGNGGKPGDGTLCTSNAFVLTLDAFGDATSDFTYKGQPAPNGKKYVLATVTVKNVTLDSMSPYFLVGCLTELKDGDGDTYSATDILKKSTNVPVPGDNVDAGASKTIRYLFTLPSNESATTLSLSFNTGLKWMWNVAS